MKIQGVEGNKPFKLKWFGKTGKFETNFSKLTK
jgi:hypothetical protein